MASPLRTLFGEGFRIFFLAAPAWAVLALAAWTAWLAGLDGTVPAGAPVLWHAQEMIFGYGGAALGGFFLTAAPNWTGSPAAGRRYIALAAGLWLAGRVAVWLSGTLDPLAVAAVDLAFLPMLGVKLAVMLMRRPKPQNLMFLGLIAIIWAGALQVHLARIGVGGVDAGAGLRTGLLGLAALIAVVGGRVTPAFTRNAMLREGRETGLPASRGRLDAAGIAAAVLLGLAWPLGLPDPVLGVLALAAGGLQAARLAGWRSGWTRREPLLWALHLGFAALALGYLAVGLARLGIGDDTAAFHLLGIGAVGGMTLAVMARASLGHAGRDLVAPGGLWLAFLMLPMAAVLRWAASALAPAWHLPLSLAAAALWVGAFALFLVRFWPVLTTPRGTARQGSA